MHSQCSQYSNMKGAALTQAQILAGKSRMCGHGFGCGCGFGYCHMLQVVGGGLGGRNGGANHLASAYVLSMKSLTA